MRSDGRRRPDADRPGGLRPRRRPARAGATAGRTPARSRSGRRPAARTPRRRTGRGGRRASPGRARTAPRRRPAGVPDVERRRCVLVEPAGRLVQQRVALPHDPVELETPGVVLHGECDQRVVEEAAAFGGPPFTRVRSSGENTVTRTTPRRSRAARQPLPVDLDEVSPGRAELGLDRRHRPSASRTRARSTARSAPRPDERLGRCTAEARQRGQVRHRLDEVGLALPVVAHDQGRPGDRREQGLGVVPEVEEFEPLDDHSAAGT